MRIQKGFRLHRKQRGVAATKIQAWWRGLLWRNSAAGKSLLQRIKERREVRRCPYITLGPIVAAKLTSHSIRSFNEADRLAVLCCTCRGSDSNEFVGWRLWSVSGPCETVCWRSMPNIGFLMWKIFDRYVLPPPSTVLSASQPFAVASRHDPPASFPRHSSPWRLQLK